MNYSLEGRPGLPVLVFSHSLGADSSMWDPLIPYLKGDFQILRFDTRGHGANQEYLLKSSFSIDELAGDLIELLDRLGIDAVYFCGLSMGGLLGQWLALNHPERIKMLVLSNTAAKIGQSAQWDERIAYVQQHGFEGLVDVTIERWFTDAFQQQNPEIVAHTRSVILANKVPGYTACCAVLRDADFREKLGEIKVPTLVITGKDDPVTSVADAQYLASNIPEAMLHILPCRHLAATELAADYAQLLINFWNKKKP